MQYKATRYTLYTLHNHDTSAIYNYKVTVFLYMHFSIRAIKTFFKIPPLYAKQATDNISYSEAY